MSINELSPIEKWQMSDQVRKCPEIRLNGRHWIDYAESLKNQKADADGIISIQLVGDQ